MSVCWLHVLILPLFCVRSKKEEREREQSLCKTWERGRQGGLGLTARKEQLSRADQIEACGGGVPQGRSC